MRRPPPGKYVTVSTAGEPFRAFVPAQLPPKPAVEWTPALRRRFDHALLALGRLEPGHCISAGGKKAKRKQAGG